MPSHEIIIKSIAIALIFAGVLLPFLSLPSARKIQRNLRNCVELRRKWRVIFNLILLFIIGFVAFGAILLFDFPLPMDLIVGIVFFGGACFVLLIVRLASMRDISNGKGLEGRISRLNDCMLGFSQRHGDNIRRLTRLCGESLEGDFALYSRIEEGAINTLAAWNAPDDLKLTDSAEGRLCFDVIRLGSDGRVFCVRDLGGTSYADTDPNVKIYNLRSFMGMPVKCNDAIIGALCVAFQNDFDPDEEDIEFLRILASAVGVEEERRVASEALAKAHSDLETRVKERTAELAEANERLMIDIAERKKAEEALSKSETILQKVFEVIPDMVAVIDRNLRLVHSNWQGGYEYVPEEIRNASPFCYDAYYPELGRPCDNCHALEVFRTGKPVSAEKFNPRIGMVEVRAFPIFDDGGQVVMVAEYVRNITEQRRMEEELRKAHKLESLGVLAGGIAHDFNNLLTGILGNISMAKLTVDPGSKAVKRLDEAEKAVTRSQDLAQQLIAFSKGGAPVKKTASIEQIVRESATFALRGSDAKCEFDIADDLWLVEVDEGQLNQVINNLIINADQAMESNGMIKVRIENEVVPPHNEMSLKEGRYIRIAVEDRGAGIPDTVIHKIFDPYFTTKEQGNGLGLAAVYSIIKNHDGFVGVDSEEGVGTSFFVYLPSSENGAPQAMESKPDVLAGSSKILVMDDEELIREVATDILDYLGYSAVACPDGKTAIELYRNAMTAGEPFAAVLMDLTIPGGMGGQETMRRLREIDPAVVGIVSSGYCSDPVLSNYKHYGFSGIVEKPYAPNVLGKVLNDLLR